jgi:TusA-related sulfurtransferase
MGTKRRLSFFAFPCEICPVFPGRLFLRQSPMTDGVPQWQFDDEFDGGEETCGRVIVNLYLYIRDQEPGRRLLVISRDPGAPVELPAWCRMTKNQLTAMQHPYYLITLKPELIKE